jgi:hypothetical protein
MSLIGREMEKENNVPLLGEFGVNKIADMQCV